MRSGALTALAAVLAGCADSGQDRETALPEGELLRQARAIHERVIAIDSHDDIPPDFATADADPGVRGERQLNIPKMREGGLDAGFFIVYVPQTRRSPGNYEEAKQAALTKFDAIRRMTEMYPDQIELAYSADDLERIHGAGKLVACIGVENGYAIGSDLSLLERYHQLGARYITLAHNGHNDIADSVRPRPALGDGDAEHGGVSPFGERVIAEMNRLGILVDVSHISRQAMLDAARLSRAPIIASHSAMRALVDVPRNLDDEQLIALKQNGGVVQVVAVSSFITPQPDVKRRAINALREELGMGDEQAYEYAPRDVRREYWRRRAELDRKWPRASVHDLVDHIDYAVQRIGIDHVGIASDFDGGGGLEGWADASETFNVTLELVRRGYSEAEIAKLWGGNLLRVWREAERVSAELRGSG